MSLVGFRVVQVLVGQLLKADLLLFVDTQVFAFGYLDLGVLHKAKGRKERAKECIAEAVNLFEQCEAEVYIKRAKEALENLG